MLPRPVRLNNPGDLKRVPGVVWQGEAPDQTDPDFVGFETPEYGFRALAVTLSTYFTVHGLQTVCAIIGRFAPASENDTAAYIADVANRCGVGPYDVIAVRSYPVMLALCLGVAHHEAGGDYWTSAQAIAGMALAGIKPA